MSRIGTFGVVDSASLKRALPPFILMSIVKRPCSSLVL